MKHTKISFYGLVACISFTVLVLAYSCSPQKRFKRLTKHNPSLLDSVSKTDTVHVVDSVTIQTTHYITNTELDSIIAPCDTVVRWKIREQIQQRCNVESLIGRSKVFRMIGGTYTLIAKGNDLTLVEDSRQVHTETIVYIPNDKCEDEKKGMIKDFKKVKRDSFLIGLVMGMLGMLFVILLIVALVKWGFR